MFMGNSLLQDSREYLYAADNLLNKHTLYAWNLNHAWNPDWLSKRPFLYPLILAGFKLLSFGNSQLFFFLIYLVQNIVSIFSFKMILDVADKKGMTAKWTYAGIFALFSLSQYIYSNMIMSEIWLQFCMVAIIRILCCNALNNRNLLLISLLIIAGMSLKPVLQFCAILFPLLYITLHLKKFRVSSAAISLLPILFYISVSFWNQSRSNYFHYSSISNINLLHYNTYSLLLYQQGSRKADSIIDRIHTEAQIKPDYADEQKHIRNSCKNIIKENLFTYAFLHLRGMIFCLTDPGRFDITQFFGLPHGKNLLYETNKTGAVKTVINSFIKGPGFLLLLLFIFNLFRAFVMMRFIFLKHMPLAFKICLLAFPAYILVLTGPIGTSRFFMPLIPFAFLMFISVFRRKQI